MSALPQQQVLISVDKHIYPDNYFLLEAQNDNAHDLFTAVSIEQTAVDGVATGVETFVEAAASPAVRQRDVTTRVDEEATLADLKRQTFVPSEVKRNREFPLPGNWTSFKCWGRSELFLCTRRSEVFYYPGQPLASFLKQLIMLDTKKTDKLIENYTN